MKNVEKKGYLERNIFYSLSHVKKKKNHLEKENEIIQFHTWKKEN